MLGIQHAEVNPEQAVEIRELKLVERSQRVGARRVTQLFGDLAQGQAAVLQCLEAAELRRRQALFQALDGLGVGLGACGLVLLGVDESLKSRVRSDKTQVGCLGRQYQRKRHVGVPGENSETHAAQEDEQVPLIQKRFLDVFSQAHGDRNPSRVRRSCRSSAGAAAFFKLADQITKIIHRLLKFLFPLHLLGRSVRGFDGQFVQDGAG